MENAAYEMVETMEYLLKKNDAKTAWNLQSEFCKIWNAQQPDSPEREAMKAVWNKAMIKWH
jgi:hypothetical protein